MKASVVDIRYKMTEVLNALERNETVEILYHGKTKGIIKPLAAQMAKSVSEHPFFGMDKESGEQVEATMKKLREDRYSDLRH